MTDTEPAAPRTEPAAAPPIKRGPGRPRKTPRVGNGDTRPTPPPSSAGRSPGRPTNIDRLADHLATQFLGLGMLVFAFNSAVGAILVEDAPAHAKALAALAEQNPKVRKLLEGTITGSAWLGVAIAFGSTAMRVSGALREQGTADTAPPPFPFTFSPPAPEANGGT